MKPENLRAMEPNVLKDELVKLMKTEFMLKLQKGTGQLKKTHELRVARRNIARLKTILHEKGV